MASENSIRKIKLIGYGSLVNQKSLRKTIKQHSNFHEVWVHGYRRLFDLRSIKQLYEPWDRNIAVLNVEAAKHAKFNAVLFEVNLKQFHAILKREKTYSLVKVKYSNYHTNKVEGEAFLFIGLEEDIHKNLNPNTHYFHICRRGGYSISKKFGQDWDKTTFLGNGKSVYSLRNQLIDPKLYSDV